MIRTLIKYKYFFFTFLITIQMAGQEIGHIKKDNHFIKLNKTKTEFCLIYSDMNSNDLIHKNSFSFSNKETIYKIIMDGFKNNNNHQIYIKVSNETIVKLKYIKIPIPS